VNSDSTAPGPKGVDQSASLAEGQILHRMLQDESGQDYYVYVPTAGGRDAPIFVSIHDISRDAEEQAKAFAKICEARGAVLVAPHFAVDRYPEYQRLGRSKEPKNAGPRADATLDAILAEVTSLLGTTKSSTHLFGFAAGARFAMRYTMANPTHVGGAVIAMAGTYTFPDPERRFPQGIAPGDRRPELSFDPDRFLRVPMTVFAEENEAVSKRPRRLERVGESPGALSRSNGRKWVDAMAAAAEERQLQPRVWFEPIDGPVHSFKALTENPGLIDRIFDALFGSAIDASSSTANPNETVEGSETDTTEAAAPVEREPVWSILRSLPSLSPREAGRTLKDLIAREIQNVRNSPTPLWQRIRPIALPMILIGGLIAMAAPIAFWGHYRSTHLVSREATVRGHIADLGARVDGVVLAIEVDAGDQVEAGQVLARLDDRHFQAKLMQARSEFQKATSELDVERLAIANERKRLESSLRGMSAELSAARSETAAAESRAEESLRRLNLQKTLAQDGLVAEERIRTAETELRTARAMAAASRADQKVAVAGQDLAEVEYEGIAVRESRIAVLESDIAGYEAELAVAMADIEATIIRAPEGGAVVRRIVEPGGSTVVGQPIISIWLGEETWVEAWVDEDDLGFLEVGSPATVTFKSHPDQEFAGVVEMLAVSTDVELPDSEVPQPRHERMRDAPVISVRIRLENPPEDLFPGLSAIVGIRKKDS
jgi:multidrug resistance efflux pump